MSINENVGEDDRRLPKGAKVGVLKPSTDSAAKPEKPDRIKRMRAKLRLGNIDEEDALALRVAALRLVLIVLYVLIVGTTVGLAIRFFMATSGINGGHF